MKAMTAAVIVLLAQEGKLRFDDPVSKYVSGVPNGDDITISYSQGGAGGGIRYEQPGRMTTFGGNSGGSPYWIGAPAPGGVGREAQVIGVPNWFMLRRPA